MSEPQHFRLCSTCKTPIPFEARYYVCSVSTCNRRPTALYFCSVPCWDAHVPDARHRDAWAEEATAPTREQFLSERASSAPEASTSEAARRRVVGVQGGVPNAPAEEVDDIPKEVLVVVSKLKAEGLSILLIDKNVHALTKVADRHFVIERGRVVWSGSSAELTAAPDVQHRYLGI